MKWIDVQDIAEELDERYPDMDAESVSFTKLRDLVRGLPNFDDDHNGCNERILEAIQSKWIAL